MNSPDQDLATHYEEALHKIRALVHGACALRERDDLMQYLEDEWQKQRRNAELYTAQNNTRRTAGIVTGDTYSNGN